MSSIERTIQLSYRHRVLFTQGVFNPENLVLKDALVNEQPGRTRKALVVVDEMLAQAQPFLVRTIEAYFAAHSDSLNLVCPPMIIEGGERAKNSYFHVS